MAKAHITERRSDETDRSPRSTPREPAGRPAGQVEVLQRLVGNRAVNRMLGADLEVTAADHEFEHGAALAERSLTTAPPSGPAAHSGATAGAASRRPSTLATGPGAALPTALRSRLEPSLGRLDGVRLHRGSDADAMTSALGAEAMTHGSDIFVSRSFDRAGTPDGDRLLAHEAAHATGAAAASGLVHLKRVKKHLDFIKIKKKSTHITRMLTSKALGAIGATAAADQVMTDASGDQIDAYGHWWFEYGGLATPGDLSSWRPSGSYGWWPAQSVSIAQTLKIDRVDGVLNQGDAEDPHQGDTAETEYHPVLEVDDKESYASVRDRVDAELDSFAHGFTGSWNWRLAWGKNCHTFVDRAKKKLKLHHQKSKQWLTGEGIADKGPPPAPLKTYAEILDKFDLWRGMGYGALGYLSTMSITAEEMLALKPNERSGLLALLNDGADAFNVLTPKELSERIAEVWGDESMEGYLG